MLAQRVFRHQLPAHPVLVDAVDFACATGGDAVPLKRRTSCPVDAAVTITLGMGGVDCDCAAAAVTAPAAVGTVEAVAIEVVEVDAEAVDTAAAVRGAGAGPGTTGEAATRLPAVDGALPDSDASAVGKDDQLPLCSTLPLSL